MTRAETGPAVTVERFFQFSLLGLVVSGYLAVAGSGYLDYPTLALTAAGLAARALRIAGLLRVEFPERLVTLVTLAYIGFFLLDYFLLSRDFLTATVHLVFFLAVFKILTARTNRDFLYTAIIAFLELLAAAILSFNFNFFLFLALFLLCAIATLTSGEMRRAMHRTAPPPRTGLKRFYPRLAFVSVAVTTGILLLTAGLFFVLPRTADAALSRLGGRRVYLPGFANEVTLGDIGEIKITSRPIFHARIFSRSAPTGLKWRGSALAEFDGKRWLNPSPRTEPLYTENGHARINLPAAQPGVRHLDYQVDLDTAETDALFLIGTPESIDLRQPVILRTNTGGYRLSRFPQPGFHYDAYSRLEDPPEVAPPGQSAVVLDASARRLYLQLPRLDPRIPELARSFASQATTDLERARAVERRLRSGYGYSLELPSMELADPLAYFLFTRKKGYCEYFASAMTVMLRALGIPARLATGFQSGMYNPISELWVVRASDAHSWVEAWIPGYGWTTFDPTPPDPNAPSLGLATRIGFYLDAAQTFWREWVVSYNISRQGILTDRVEQGTRRLGLRWSDSLASLLVDWPARSAVAFRHYGAGFGIAILLGLAVCLFGPSAVRVFRLRRRFRQVRRGHVATGDATLLYHRMLQILKQRGYQKPPWFTPAEFAASLSESGCGPAVAEFTSTYNAWRFGGRTGVAPRLSQLLEELERQPS